MRIGFVSGIWILTGASAAMLGVYGVLSRKKKQDLIDRSGSETEHPDICSEHILSKDDYL